MADHPNEPLPPPAGVSGDAGKTSNQSAPEADAILVPRWIVYFQGALLGVVAATFFIFGMMVGNLTSGANSAAEQKLNVRISGEVVYQREGRELPDVHAVVMFLPVNLKPEQRSDANLVHPDTFQPLDNAGIDSVNALGGSIVRVNERGMFDVVVDGPQEYYVLVISANQKPESTPTFNKLQKAAVATFFKPVEDVIRGNQFYWTTLFADRDTMTIQKIVFD
jgi:hypothetical protein